MRTVQFGGNNNVYVFYLYKKRVLFCLFCFVNKKISKRSTANKAKMSLIKALLGYKSR